MTHFVPPLSLPFPSLFPPLSLPSPPLFASPLSLPSILPLYPPPLSFPSILPLYPSPLSFPSILPLYPPLSFPSILPLYPSPLSFPSILPLYPSPLSFPSILPLYPSPLSFPFPSLPPSPLPFLPSCSFSGQSVFPIFLKEPLTCSVLEACLLGHWRPAYLGTIYNELFPFLSPKNWQC